RRSDDVEVIDRVARRGFVGKGDRPGLAQRREQRVVALGGRAPLRGPRIQVAKLDAEERGLQRIEPAVVAFELMVVLLRLSVVTDHADVFRDGFIVGGHRTRFTAGAEVLARVKAEGRSFSERSCSRLAVSGAVGLAG